ncbi:hypothetical protein Taro_028999 [Colocasia esculenta]|uniref:Uncharacterized protein n=1 Tax=Colocasia esculenta TaxID=4460 RepID=A0A843VHV3_COLES|nr:hypothetical protein [Colocasia esculenta]
MWRSSWWLSSCGTTTRSRSPSPSRLLRPAQTTLLKSTKCVLPKSRTVRAFPFLICFTYFKTELEKTHNMKFILLVVLVRFNVELFV